MLIQTARLRMRPFTERDAVGHYHAILSDPDIMRFLPGGEPRPLEKAYEWAAYFAEFQAEHGFSVWVVLDRAQGGVIGHCGLCYLPDTTQVEIAYALAKPLWGQGLITEAARAALRFGFEEVGLEEILAVFVPGNAASQRVMIKLGMQYDGVKPAYGTNLPQYSIQREMFDPGDAPYSVTY